MISGYNNSWLKKDTFLEWSNCIADVNKGKIGTYAADTFRELLKIYIPLEKPINIGCSIKDDIYSCSFIVLLSYRDIKIDVKLDVNACSRNDVEQYIKLKVTDAFKKWLIEKNLQNPFKKTDPERNDALDAYRYAMEMFKSYPIAHVVSKEETSEGIKFNVAFEKEKNMNKKLYDVEYDNEVVAIKEKAQSEKKALDAKVEEDLAKAEAKREKAQTREEATTWAFKIKTMYNALLEEGFTEDLATKFIEIQISK